jgi:ubiquinol-cytochrome c reductase cytochrome c1 subunit
MFRKITISAVSALALTATMALAEGGDAHIEDVPFSFEGAFGAFDEHQLQRGLQVYTEVCAACHGLKFVPIRSLSDEGGPHLPEDQVRAYAKNYTVVDKDTGEDREALPTDNFPANTGAGAPDLSLMAKARAGFHGPMGLGINQLVKGMGGPEYLVAILTGYTGEEKVEAGETFYENLAYPGGWIKMPPPLSDDLVTYADGHEATTHHMAEDVSAFMMWTAEPKLMARKQAGFKAVVLLTLLAGLLYLTNKRLWSAIKGPKKH